MSLHPKPLGILKPIGGGDPIPLKKEELVVGRRPTCDIRLDFERISGKHCQLRFVNGVWHVRDLNSTNGTTVNGQKIFSEHGLMPDDELSIAGHLFMLDYDPVAPTSLMDANQILEEEMAEGRRRSLMEMAGIGVDAESSYRRSRTQGIPEREKSAPVPTVTPDELAVDPLAEEPLPTGKSTPPVSDEDFLSLIRDDLEKKGKSR